MVWNIQYYSHLIDNVVKNKLRYWKFINNSDILYYFLIFLLLLTMFINQISLDSIISLQFLLIKFDKLIIELINWKFGLFRRKDIGNNKKGRLASLHKFCLIFGTILWLQGIRTSNPCIYIQIHSTFIHLNIYWVLWWSSH